MYSQTEKCATCPIGQSRGEDNDGRTIKAGQGQEFTGQFLSPSSMHYVQFAVYSSSVPCYTIKAPKGLGEIWLINHPGTQVRGESRPGAYYVVKAFSSKDQAIEYAKLYRAQQIDCWYNPAITGKKILIERVAY